MAMPRVEIGDEIFGHQSASFANGLRWRDAPKDYGPHKTIYDRSPLAPAGGVQPHLR